VSIAMPGVSYGDRPDMRRKIQYREELKASVSSARHELRVFA
jgi:hypothetical protein